MGKVLFRFEMNNKPITNMAELEAFNTVVKAFNDQFGECEELIRQFTENKKLNAFLTAMEAYRKMDVPDSAHLSPPIQKIQFCRGEDGKFKTYRCEITTPVMKGGYYIHFKQKRVKAFMEENKAGLQKLGNGAISNIDDMVTMVDQSMQQHLMQQYHEDMKKGE